MIGTSVTQTETFNMVSDIHFSVSEEHIHVLSQLEICGRFREHRKTLTAPNKLNNWHQQKHVAFWKKCQRHQYFWKTRTLFVAWLYGQRKWHGMNTGLQLSAHKTLEWALKYWKLYEIGMNNTNALDWSSLQPLWAIWFLKLGWLV